MILKKWWVLLWNNLTLKLSHKFFLVVTLRVIVDEFHNNKTNIFHCFVDFSKYIDTVPRDKLWKSLEEKPVPLE